jgi:hypothetical protein
VGWASRPSSAYTILIHVLTDSIAALPSRYSAFHSAEECLHFSPFSIWLSWKCIVRTAIEEKIRKSFQIYSRSEVRKFWSFLPRCDTCTFLSGISQITAPEQLQIVRKAIRKSGNWERDYHFDISVKGFLTSSITFLSPYWFQLGEFLNFVQLSFVILYF